MFALLVAGTLFVAWRAPAATGAVAAAAALVFVVFAEWAVRGNPDMLVLPGGPLPGIGPAATDGSVSLHLITAAIFAVGFGAAGFLAQGRSVSAIMPVVWSAAAVFTPLALLIALYARIAHLDRSIPFAILAVVLAAAYGAATETLTRRDNRPGLPISIALFATGALGALALALTFALEKGWLTIALALMSMGTAWISMQRPIPFLRSLAAILAGIVVLRIGYEPRIVGDAVGTTPIFNWLLWGYGIPALSFWTASIFLRRRGDDAPLRTVEAAAILFTVLLAFMEIRHAVNGGDVYRDNAGLTEIALQVCVALAMAIGLERLRIRTGSIVHNVGAVLLTVFAGLASVFGLMLLETPIFWPTDVGGVFINLLLLGYALPAVLALLLSYAVAGRRRACYANTIAAGALVLALTYVTFEIRRLYHGPVLTSGATSGAEQYTYSIAWLAFGVALLGIGILFNSQRARLASAAVIALTILKAFLIDMSTLTGVYRALSFMCLGLVLVAIGWLYQRILFRRQTPPPGPVVQPGRISYAPLGRNRRPARPAALSGRPHRIEELADFELEAVAVAGQRLRRGENLRRGRAGLAGAALHVGDVGGDLLGALRRLLHVAGNLLRRRALLFHRRRDGRGDLRQFFDGAADFLDGVDRLLGRGLDAGDLLADLAGRLRGLLGQRLHFGRHHRKAAAGLAGARRLDGGIQRQQIGLSRRWC